MLTKGWTWFPVGLILTLKPENHSNTSNNAFHMCFLPQTSIFTEAAILIGSIAQRQTHESCLHSNLPGV